MATPGEDFHVRPSNSELAERANRLRAAVRAGGGNLVVAQRSGVPLGTLNNYLGGRDMKTSALVALADACKVSLDWLAAGRGSMVPLTAPAEPTPEPTTRSHGLRDFGAASPAQPSNRLNIPAIVKAIEIVEAVAGISEFRDNPKALAERIATTYALLTRPDLDKSPPL